ncbi:type VI secretion system tip protein TssI/VgrG [Sulfurimonas sp.]|uniref:type VI secretion system tip protein TssI/VgrG n=1 Tax=Sulfurimonas sp. TaxID=2022749 RepID=UPI002B460F16|nr:type VI secretion system tip protein TssI/VgrG [Sulfurimonas sp.]
MSQLASPMNNKIHQRISAQLKLSEYNQADTMMQGRDSYSVYELEGKSSILTGYEYKLTFISDEEINVEDIVDTETELHLRDETSPLNSKKIYGKIIEAKENGSVARKKLYQIKIVSPLHYLSLNQRYEVYQEMNIPDIISSIIAKYSVLLNIQLDVKIDTQTIPKRHTCTQYKQSDFEFIKMLCEEEGYILLIDASSNNPYTVTLCELNEHAPLNTEIIECTYNKVKTFSTSAQAQDYYENKKPSLDFSIQAGQVMHSHTFADNEVTSQLRSDIKKETLRDRLDKLDESLYKDLSRYAKIDAEQGFSQGIRVLGNSEELSVNDGVVLNLKDIKGHKNTQVIVLSVKYKATFPNALDEYAQVADDEQQAQYSVEFIAIPSEVIYRPQVITSKPRIHSIQTAIVSNTDKDTQKFANEIDVNERGEIKVIFHFDEKRPTSAYVPLSNIYSGDGYGVQFLPRVNSEVIVSFINGDIDRPIITGALHNGENRHPFNLPKEKTKSFIKTQTTPQYEDKEGYNELLFEDKQGEELLSLRAQNDYELNVLNNSNTHIANNKKTIIDNDLELSVQNDSTQTIGNDKKVNILGNEIKTIEKEQILTIKEDQEIHILKDSNSIVNNNSFNVVQKDLTQRVKGFSTSFVEKDTQQKHLGSKYQQVGENLAIEVKKAYSLKAKTIKQAAKTIELDSAKGISLKVGGNVLTVDSSGIHFKTSNYDDNSANAGVTSKTVSIQDLKKPLYEKIRVIGMQTSISKQDKITQELIYTAKVEKYEDGTWSETTELNPTQTAQLKWYFIKNNDKQDRDILTNTPTDDEIEIDALIMKVKLQDDNIQHYGHAHCFVNSPEDETEGYGLSELKCQVNVVEVLGKNIVEPHSTQVNYSVELNIDNPTKDEIKDLKVEIQEKDSSGKVTTIEEKVKDDLSVEHKLKAKKEDEPKLVEINIKVYPREYPKNTAETISYVRPTLEGEITNVSIDKPTQAFAKVVKPDEEIIIKANANIGEGIEIQLDIVTLLKNINEPKVCSFEEFVKNKEIQKTLTMQEIATMLSIDINDIQDIQAVVKHKDKEYKSNKTSIQRTLKSKLYKEDKVLNDIVEDIQKIVFKKGSKGNEVKLIQEALQKMKIDIGSDGIDAKLGNDGEQAVMTFQENYKATNNTHQYNQSKADGVVGKNTLLALDEALVEGWGYVKPNCKITVEQLKQIFIKATNSKLAETAKTFNQYCQVFEINTPLRVAHFFAQCREEVGNNIDIVENLNYKASVLKSGYPFLYFKNHPDEAEQYGRTDSHSANQEAIANRSYSKRNGNGDIASGDGWKFRGKGFIQLTGKSNYKGSNKILKEKVPELGIDLLNNTTIMETIEGSLLSAMAYWTDKKINKIADIAYTYEDVNKVTNIVNMYTKSKTKRQEHFKKTIEIFKEGS